MSILTDKLKHNQAPANQGPAPDPKPQHFQTKTPQDPPEAHNEIEEDKTFDYATPHSDGFTFHFADGSSVKTENGVMHLNEVQHHEIQRLLKKGRPDIAQNMVLTDRDAAEKTARAYLEELARKRAGHSGTSSTASRHQLTQDQGQVPVRNLDVIEVDTSLIHGGDSSHEEDLKRQQNGNNA